MPWLTKEEEDAAKERKRTYEAMQSSENGVASSHQQGQPANAGTQLTVPSAKKLATEIAGAKALERARRGGCCRAERKAACRRHGEPARARPRPHRLEGGPGGARGRKARATEHRRRTARERLNIGFDYT